MNCKTIKKNTRSCPDGCNLCVEACASSHGGFPLISRVSLPGSGIETVDICNQCSNPECVAICPSGALSKNSDGVVLADEEICVGCGLCSLACTYGGIHMRPEEKKAKKCDMCGTNRPACAEACPYGVLEEKHVDGLLEELDGDIMTHGTVFCAGCMMEHLVRFTMRVLGKDILLVGSPACCIVGGRVKAAHYGALMTNASASMTGITRYYRRIKKDITCVAICGDGATADIQFQVLSAAAERGERFLYICYDNEAYMNTGIQRSSRTPQYSWTTTTHVGPNARGKKGEPKNVPLLMAFHNIPYAATASLGDLKDYAQKLREAREAAKTGVAYLHVMAPCPTGWRSEPAEAMELCRLMLETNYTPMWRARYGRFTMTRVNDNPRPISDFVKKMGRFAHVTDEEIENIQKYVDCNYRQMLALSRALPEETEDLEDTCV